MVCGFVRQSGFVLVVSVQLRNVPFWQSRCSKDGLVHVGQCGDCRGLAVKASPGAALFVQSGSVLALQVADRCGSHSYTSSCISAFCNSNFVSNPATGLSVATSERM